MPGSVCVEGGEGLLVKLKSGVFLQKHACKNGVAVTPVIPALRRLRQSENGEVEPRLVPTQLSYWVRTCQKEKQATTTPLHKQKQTKAKTTTKRKRIVYVDVRTGLVRSTMLSPLQAAPAAPFWGHHLGQCLGLPRFR